MAEPVYALSGKRVYVAGHRGMVGQAICRRLEREGCTVLTAGRQEADLTRQAEAEEWIAENKPDAVFVAAAKVGGILANDSFPADFLYEKPDDRGQCYPRFAPVGCRKADVPWIELYLSQAGRTADAGGCAA